MVSSKEIPLGEVDQKSLPAFVVNKIADGQRKRNPTASKNENVIMEEDPIIYGGLVEVLKKII